MKSIISQNCRIRYPEEFRVGDYSIVDDFCYFSTKVDLGKFVHIAANCTVAGGPSHTYKHCDYGSLASGVKLYCGSDDFKNDIGNVLPSGMEDIKDKVIFGDVICEKFVTIGANSVVMPKQHIPEGTCVGAMSFVPSGFKFDPWSIYVGIHKLRKVGVRNRDNVLRQRDEIEKRLLNGN